MSLLGKALKKAQISRENLQENEKKDIVYLSDVPESRTKSVLTALLAAGTTVAIITSMAAIMLTLKNSESKQIQVLGLEKTIKTQEKTIKTQDKAIKIQEKTIKIQFKRIDDIIIAINKDQKYSNSQTGELNSRLNKESLAIKDRMDNMTLTDNAHYADLKNAVLNDKQAISYLNNYTKKLEQKVEAMSVTDSLAKDTTSPASGT
jgi:hypothetical protein